MKNIKTSALAIALVSGFIITADDRSDAYWLMRAHNCAEEQMIITEYVDLHVENFAVKDENGKNIYQIALDRHKETNSIPCAKIAVFLRQQHERLRNKLNEEAKVLDEAEKTFELSLPHQ